MYSQAQGLKAMPAAKGLAISFETTMVAALKMAVYHAFRDRAGMQWVLAAMNGRISFKACRQDLLRGGHIDHTPSTTLSERTTMFCFCLPVD
jgi:hypothetical protein